ncbi:L-serine ammonia-lyase, iron-sulfur-dependent subunit beta [Patescibacteria group bacterium]|nr:L-serine ammonia-lyase, iron-sulfur-dependent subunit beta [Patescibacteria group bacterium]MBU1683796.1 L-serine ammonia-lyase, iron-sulfur-dependent subunit beta [Patescibacteria group bacterium]MBU1935685.1 L-serine ammonia-lyase, iron-sulfur-dependent subunit beta [Patescibacteria group bacterium]
MKVSIFDVAGPIMVGPSSSHTAGACKIGQIARALFRGTPTNVKFYLYGSFATVYQGHATDKALLAGVMKLWTSDSNIRNAFEIAKEKKIEYEFIPFKISTPEHHPNTVRIILENRNRKLSVVGSSLGGGNVKITQINNVPIDLEIMAGRFFSIIIGHENAPKVLDPLYEKLKEWGSAIANSQTCSVKKNSVTILNIEGFIPKLPQVLELEKLPGIQFVRALTKLLKY